LKRARARFIAATASFTARSIQIDLEDLQVEYERVTAQVAVAEKKLKTFDKVSYDYLLFCCFISSYPFGRI
jgi:hypothetical protein